MNEKVEPALTAEEWVAEGGPAISRLPFQAWAIPSGLVVVAIDGERGVGIDAPHAVAAMLLHGQPFGFTWAMVDALEQAVFNDADPGDHTRLSREAIAHIAALLPPRESSP